MADFSQLVRARLGAQPPASTHPDADVLAAFAERRLSGTERRQALAHLSLCAACREIVALASQEQTLDAVASHERARRRFAIWRWVLVGALAVLAVSATVLLRIEKPEPAVVAQQVSPPAAPSSATVATEPEARASADTLVAKPERRQSKTNAESKTLNGSPSQHQAEAADALSAREAPAVTGGLAATQAQNAPIVAQRRAAAEPALAPTTPPPPPPPAAQPAQTLDQLAQPNQQATQQKQQGAVSTVEAQAAPAPQQQQSASQSSYGYGSAAGVAGGLVSKSDIEAKTAKARRAAPDAAAQANEVTVQGRAAALKRSFWNGAPAQWTISADGKLQRATQAGQQGPMWQPVDVGEPAIFRVVNANLNDVWAGGNGGALFHSADAGEHWTRIVPKDGDHKLEGDVISLTIAGAVNQIIRLRTSAGQSWISNDGGKTWKVESL